MMEHKAHLHPSAAPPMSLVLLLLLSLLLLLLLLLPMPATVPRACRAAFLAQRGRWRVIPSPYPGPC
jgi:hypothetical protein